MLSIKRRTPPGVRELKLSHRVNYYEVKRRTPPGVRELKLLDADRGALDEKSHPSRGA